VTLGKGLLVYTPLAYSLRVVFIRLSTFEKSAARLLTEAEVLEMEILLITNPTAGAVIPGGKGLRKLRQALAGRGKRGGARVIYYFISTHAQIYLVYAYAKNEQENLTQTQIKQLASLLP
jgi:hypothetical protein